MSRQARDQQLCVPAENPTWCYHPSRSYTLKVSPRYLCAAVCINMVFERRGLPVWDDMELACALGLVVPPSERNFYPCAELSAEQGEWGIHPQEPPGRMSSFLAANDVPLSFTFVRVSEIPTDSVAAFLGDNLLLDHDILVGYSFATVFGIGADVGHVGLVRGIEIRSECVELVEPEEPTLKVVALPQLLRGVSRVGDGFWLMTTPSATISMHYPT